MSDMAKSKAQAKVSEYEAEVATLESQLADAQEELEGSTAAGGLLDKVKDTPVLGDLTSGLRREPESTRRPRRPRWIASSPNSTRPAPNWNGRERHKTRSNR